MKTMLVDCTATYLEGEIARLEAENAKLRELVDLMRQERDEALTKRNQAVAALEDK